MPILYGIYTFNESPHLLPSAIDLHYEQHYKNIYQLIHNGLTWLQLRTKSPTAKALSFSIKIFELCYTHKITLIINDHLHWIPLLTQHYPHGKLGIHLGQNDETIEKARQLNPNIIVGITCHNSLDMAHEAISKGANYVALGRFYPSNTKPSASKANLKQLIQLRKETQCKIAVIGGINFDNAQPLIQAGADLICMGESLIELINQNPLKCLNQLK